MHKSKVYLNLLLPLLFILTIPNSVFSNPTTLNPYQTWQLTEKRLDNAINHLLAIMSARDDAHIVWTDNREDIRDTKIGALSGVQKDPYSALATAISATAILWLDISEDITATEGLKNGIEALKKQLNACKARARARDHAHDKYVEWFWQHNSPSGPQPQGKIYSIPAVHFYTYTCGGCQETSEYPEEHRTLCYKDNSPAGCGRTYYTCIAGESSVHQPTTCVAPIEYYAQTFTRDRWTDEIHASEEVYLFTVKCRANFRMCNPNKGRHHTKIVVRIYKDERGHTRYRRTSHKNPKLHRDFKFPGE